MSADLRNAPYRDPALPVARRVEDLLARMTLEEKLAQLGCVWSTQLADQGGFAPSKAAEKLRNGTGHVTRIAAATGLRPAENASFMNAIQRWLVESTRLGIPAIVHEEALSGLQIKGASCFPQAIGQGSTWDPARIERMGRAIRRQMRAVGVRQALSPNLDVVRDPRWGRVEECYGEDPQLVARAIYDSHGILNLTHWGYLPDGNWWENPSYQNVSHGVMFPALTRSGFWKSKLW